MELSQVLAVVIFVAMFVVLVLDKAPRYVVALIAGALTITLVFLIAMKSPGAVLNVLNFGQLFQAKFWFPGHETIESHGINWQTIVFIAGMMAMVESMAETGFFAWLCLTVAKLVKYRVMPILVSFMLLSGFLAMFIDSITVLLFMTAVAIQLAHLLKFDPVPLIIAMIFAANTGGAATISGNPPNIIIGTAFGYSFMDFLTNAGVIVWAGMFVSLGFFFLVTRRSMVSSQAQMPASSQEYPQPARAIINPLLFKVDVAIFFLVIVLLVTHAETGLSIALIGVIAGSLTLVAAFKRAPHIIQRVDWRTLLFFVGLFVAVGGLEETGVLKILADYIADVSGGNLTILMTIIVWVSAVASAVVDNIPFAATMVPVIANLAQSGAFPLPAMVWALVLGGNIGGNATPIGASANVVGTAIAEREGYPIGWGRYLKYAGPSTLLVVALSWLLVIIRHS